MASSRDRRTFLKQVAGLAAGSFATAEIGEGAPPSAEQAGDNTNASDSSRPGRLSAYSYQGRIWVRVDDLLFLCYRALSGQKYPYIYPVAGPLTGLSMTEESGQPYPHHRSLFLGCDHVNGANFWQEDIGRGQIISRGPRLDVIEPDRVVIVDHCDWRPPAGEPIIADQRRFTLTAPRPDLRLIDVELGLQALTDIRVSKTNHSLFSVRAAKGLTPTGGGMLLNSDGQSGEKATFGQAARWCGFWGTRLGKAEAIVLIDHPENPWSPCPWFTRDYGFLSPTPFFWLTEQGWRLPSGESVTLRYRVVVAGGRINSAQIDRLAESFAMIARD